jgi:predicted amidohydrolase
MTIGAGLIERDNNARLFNSAVVVMPDGRYACHRKLHAFVSEHLSGTCQAADAMVLADLDSSLRDRCTGVRWIRARRPELYGVLTIPTGREQDTRTVRFEYDTKR